LFIIEIIGTIDQKIPTNQLTHEAKLIIPLQLIILNLGPPYFIEPLRSRIVMTVGEFLPFYFPKMRDPDLEDTPSLLSLDFGGAKSFITGKYPSFLISPNSNQTDPGTYLVSVALKDNNPTRMTSQYQFHLTVLPK